MHTRLLPRADAVPTCLVKLTTGFEYRNTGEHGLSAIVRAAREDEASVAYLIPPDTATVISILDRTHFRTPLDFSAVEDVRGPLV